MKRVENVTDVSFQVLLSFRNEEGPARRRGLVPFYTILSRSLLSLHLGNLMTKSHHVVRYETAPSIIIYARMTHF